ncbi:MAG: ParB/RepB/Spo0J family partition protein [Lachnospiraceae bacterium]|jgi:ParB family chromosome partitioning protein|nr:ParB/RepB/Spo0J family partition protein [Lachnospiraceae bacterium]
MATAKKKSHGLGSGLNVLIPQNNPPKANSENENEAAVDFMVPISKVEPDREQPRKFFNEDALQELAESIKQYGVFQPLLVQKEKDYYKIIAGERRWRAAKIAGLKEIPVIVKELSDQEIAEIQLIENIQREDLNPIEIAEGYRQLIDKYGFTQDELAEKISKSRTAITNTLRLLKLDERVRQMIVDELISTGHARAILSIEDSDKQYEFAQKIFDEKMSVRDVEKAIKNMQKDPKVKKDNQKIDKKTEAIYHSLEENMKQIMGTKVTIQAKNGNQGKVEIEYYSQDELDRIVNMIRTIHKA